jgi:hypothetical protein
MKDEALNIAGQCRATASSPLSKKIAVDGGNGLLCELLLDAAKSIEALAAKPVPVQEPHADDLAVDRFAAEMKTKMAKQRAKGYSGWDDPEQCPTERLQTMLVDHLAKGDPVDVGNIAMMLFCRGDSTAIAPQPLAGQRCKIVESCKSCQHSAGRRRCMLAERDFDSLERKALPPEWCPLPIYTAPPAPQQGGNHD